MLQAKTVVRKEINNHPYLFVNLVFGFFPISFILGTLIVNLNLLLFCCLGIYYLKSKVVTTKFDFSIKIIFLFFLIIFFSTSLSLAKALYFEGFEDLNLIRFTKSILFFRFFLFLIIIYLLCKFNILHFKYFFLISAFASVLIAFDIIFQYIFGFNIIGLKNPLYVHMNDPSSGLLNITGNIALKAAGRLDIRNSSFFGDEFIAGGYIQRFAFFAIFFTVLVFKNKNYTKFISTVCVICILGAGILLSGNRMPFVSFIFGLLLIFILDLKLKKILFVSLVVLLILFQFIFSSNETYKNAYSSFYGRARNVILAPFKITSDTKWNKVEETKIGEEKPVGQKTIFFENLWESPQKRLFLTAIDTWKLNKIFGNGIKSFREDCDKIGGDDVNLTEDLISGKKNRLCSTHPHNYYLEILTETGIVGLVIISLIALLFIVFIFRNFKFVKKIGIENFILLSAIISLILETQPFKTTGSLFTTNNATYLILIASIILSHKTILKIKIE